MNTESDAHALDTLKRCHWSQLKRYGKITDGYRTLEKNTLRFNPKIKATLERYKLAHWRCWQNMLAQLIRTVSRMQITFKTA